MGLGDASAGIGLHHPIKTSFQKASTQKALFLSRYRRGISEAHFCAFWRQELPDMPALLGPRSTKRCKYRQKTAVLSVGLSFCPFCFCCGWLARCAALAFFAFVFGPSGARARDPSHKTLLFTVFCCICVSGLACGLLFLGCFFPRHYLGLRWATCVTQPAIS